MPKGEHLIKHGLTIGGKTPEYNAWIGMRDRCRNKNSKNYPYYGGRGIIFCPTWESFPQFLADMGKRPSPKHTLERKNTDGNYTAENCVWATRKTQSRNRRYGHFVTHEGKRRRLSELAEENGIKYHTLQDRIYAGWEIGQALRIPPGVDRPERVRLGAPKGTNLGRKHTHETIEKMRKSALLRFERERAAS